MSNDSFVKTQISDADVFRIFQQRLLDLAESSSIHCCWKSGPGLRLEMRLDEYVAKHSCAFCANWKERMGSSQICVEHDLKTLSALLAGKDEFFIARCPAGATELIVPFWRNGICLGAVLFGPFRRPGDMVDGELVELSDSRIKSLSNIIRQLLKETIGAAYTDKIGSVSDHRIGQALVFIRKNFARPLSAEKVAAKVGLSRSRFLHLFPVQCSMSFKSYIQTLRITESCRLLSRNDLSISEIAEKLGYSSQSHFTAVFRNKMHETPVQYRQRAVKSGFISEFV